jgi:hypothetical protein
MTPNIEPPYIYSYPTDSFWKIQWAVRINEGGKEENAYEAVVFGKLRCWVWGRVHLHCWLPVR